MDASRSTSRPSLGQEPEREDTGRERKRLTQEEREQDIAIDLDRPSMTVDSEEEEAVPKCTCSL